MNKRSILATAMLVGGVLAAAPASAQATRTWVSGVGDDANPCSRTAPCKTFAGAISKTAAGGEIDCIDPAGYGAVTITKSMTIRCVGVEAGILVSGGNGINVSAGVNDVVIIDGLDIHGFGSGNNGISYNTGGSLQIRNTTIHGFIGQGINMNTPAGATQSLYIDNVIFDQNGGTTNTGGMRVVIQGTGATANVVLTNVRFTANVNAAARFDTTGSTGGVINATINNSVFSTSGIGVQLKAPTGTGAVNAVITDSTITSNNNTGILANGANVKGLVTRSSIMMNTTGVSAVNSAAVTSSQDNNLANNTTDGAFTGNTPHN